MDRRNAPRGRGAAAVMIESAAGVETGRGAGVESANTAAAETNEEVAAESDAAAEREGGATETTTSTVGGPRVRVQSGRRRVQSDCR